MWSFLKDLAEGKEFEHTVLHILQSEYPLADWKQNPDNKGVDIISWNSELTVEVKFDRMGNTTWNIFIEVECNGKPSWINKYESLSVLAYGYICEDKLELMLINIEKLREQLYTNWFREVKWWDWWRVRWVLVPIKYLKDNSIISKTISIWQQQLSQLPSNT